MCLLAMAVLLIRSPLIDSSNFGLIIDCVRNEEVMDDASFDGRGLSTGFTSMQTLVLGREIILLDRFGSSGAITAELSDIDSEKSAAILAIELKFICDCENREAELLCMLTFAKTENSCAEDVDDVLPGGDCSPSLVL